MRKLNKVNMSILKIVTRAMRTLVDSVEPEIKSVMFNLDMEVLKIEAWIEREDEDEV